MPVSTIENAFKNIGGINIESQKVLNKINGGRSAEEMIWEYFGLRKQVVTNDDGTPSGMIDEFIDPRALKIKKVRYVPYFKEKGLTEEMFYNVIPKEFIYAEPNDNSVTDTKGEQPLQDTSKRTRKPKN